MKIRVRQLKERFDAGGHTVEGVAQAIARAGLDGARAERAVANWLLGRDHPRCKAEDVRSMAKALGCDVSDIASFVSRVSHHRGSPRKAALLTDLIRGKTVVEADNLLTFTTKRAAIDVKKALKAAQTEAESNDADIGQLVVCESRVDQGPTIKRFKAKDRGRSHPIMKRTSHITVGVEERR